MYFVLKILLLKLKMFLKKLRWCLQLLYILLFRTSYRKTQLRLYFFFYVVIYLVTSDRFWLADLVEDPNLDFFNSFLKKSGQIKLELLNLKKILNSVMDSESYYKDLRNVLPWYSFSKCPAEVSNIPGSESDTSFVLVGSGCTSLIGFKIIAHSSFRTSSTVNYMSTRVWEPLTATWLQFEGTVQRSICRGQ